MLNRLTSASALFALVFGFAACGSDANKTVSTTTTKSNATTTSVAESTTTTEKETSTTDGTDGTDVTNGTDPEPELTDQEFATTVDDIITGVDATEICALNASLDELFSLNPTTKSQMKNAVRGYKAVFSGIAAAAPPEQAANAKLIRDYVSSFEASAIAVDFDPDKVVADASPEFDAAMDEFEDAVNSAC